jgi:hypothetical protein
MRRLLGCGAALAVAVALTLSLEAGRRTEAAEEKAPMIVHDVYFALNDNAPGSREKLVAACKKYLAKHDGEVFFAAGTRAEEFKRPVNDQDWDVGLHIVFRDKKAHDAYQDSPRHKQFIEENKDNWKKVRVFDSSVEP